MGRLIVRYAAQVVVFPEGPIRGAGFEEITTLENATIVCEDGAIVSIGADVEPDPADDVIDATGCTIVPGFVDCHTHLPFYGWRADEDAARLSGVRYQDIHGKEGGIFRSAALLADASDDDVIRFSVELATAMLRKGTTTLELKSGYGLSIEAELRQLRLARQLADSIPQDVSVTCLIHAVPAGKTAGEWVAECCDVLLPKAVEESLIDAVDIYVETIAFELEHAARVAHAAEALGLRKRVHADQLADNQTGSFAARWGFASADHLNHLSADGIADMAESDTAAVLLPGATFTLRQEKKPPARALIDAGAIVALGTDLNPGTSPLHSIPFVIALACRLYGLRPMEALVGATANAAHVLGMSDRGRIAVGARADLVLLDIPTFDYIAYRPDEDPVVGVVCGVGGGVEGVDASGSG
jgi:imidazolonepropionase